MMVLNTKVHSNLENNMDLVLKLGPTDLHIEDNIIKDRNMEKESFNGMYISLNKILIGENCKIMFFMDSEFINGMMEDNMQVNGEMVK